MPLDSDYEIYSAINHPFICPICPDYRWLMGNGLPPYTKKVNGREQTLIRHLYHLDGEFESYIYHDGWFQFAGSGYYDVYKNRIRETVDYDTYAGKIQFKNDTTMTIQWDGDNKILLFKRILWEPNI